jgi:hypothetical protein
VVDYLLSLNLFWEWLLEFVGPLKWAINICLLIIRKDLWMDLDKKKLFWCENCEPCMIFERGLEDEPLIILIWKTLEDCKKGMLHEKKY